METPAEIEFDGMSPSSGLRQEIDRHIAQLEKRFGRITSCRVAVRAPGDQHRNGNRFEVNIHLTLPGQRDVDVARLPSDAQRAADARTAIADAFKRARRQLQDRVRRMERLVKHHDPAPAGTIARIDQSGEFGFIATADGREIYFHRNSVLNGAFAKLKPGASVTFAEEEGDKGTQASTVRPTGKRALAASEG